MSSLIVNAGRNAANILMPGWGGIVYDTALGMAQGALAPRDVPRLSELQFLRVSEGAPIPRIYGRARVGGQVIWTSLVQRNTYTSGGGKGRGSRVTRYSYTLSFAVGICEGPVGYIGRVWADGELLDKDQFTWRSYVGDETQMPDQEVLSERSSKFAPAFRGMAYVMFEDFNLTAFGNRIPQLNFEVLSPMDELSNKIQAMTILPTVGEFGYDTTIRTKKVGTTERALNAHMRQSGSDWTESLDALQSTCPNVRWVSLPVFWFCNDLRAEHATFMPKRALAADANGPKWSVAGIDQATLKPISSITTKGSVWPGTPSDESVIAAIRDLRARGLKVLFYPQILVDVDSNLRSFSRNQQGKPKYYPSSNEIALTISQNLSPAVRDRFFRAGMSRVFSGTQGSLSYMILHYAKLCREAGGVDAFLLGGQMEKLSRTSIGSLNHPFATHLKTLGTKVREILGPNTKLSYGANWDEYGARLVTVRYENAISSHYGFPLDAYWASSSADFVGIDGGFPLSDFRDYTEPDADTKRARAIGLAKYFEENILGGEYYDWRYYFESRRHGRRRSNIRSDQWFRGAKHLPRWWGERHRVIPGRGSPAWSAWQPKSKSIWFLGQRCGAINKGSNEPNIWANPRLGDTTRPYYSNATRDDSVQRHYLHAVLSFWTKPDNNKVSTTGVPMIASDRIFVHGWEARPYPAYPYDKGAWDDEARWDTGFSLQGRLTQAPLMALIRHIGKLAHKTVSFSDAPTPQQLSDPTSDLEGYVVEKITTPANILMPLMQAFFLEAMANDTGLTFVHRGQLPVQDISEDDLVLTQDGGDMAITLKDATTLPTALKLTYWSNEDEFRPKTIESRLESEFYQTTQIDLPIVLRTDQAQNIADTLLREIWVARETARFTLCLSCVHLQVGDVVRLRGKLWRIQRMTDDGALEVDAVRFQPSIYDHYNKYKPPATPGRTPVIDPEDIIARLAKNLIPRLFSSPGGDPDLQEHRQDATGVEVTTDIKLYIADLPNLGLAKPGVPMIAASAMPWPRDIIVKPAAGGWTTNVPTPTIAGESCADFASGPVGRWDYANILDVRLHAGELMSRTPADVQQGRNRLAIRTPLGWELIQFVYAELIEVQCYRLSTLLRGLAGSDAVMAASLPAGAPVIAVEPSLVPLVDNISQLSDSMQLHYGQAQHETSRQYWRMQTFSPGYVSQKPLAPVHLRTTRRDNGDIHISWTRRSRVRADSWSHVVPLGESREAYQLRFRRANRILRQTTCTTAGYLYTLAQQQTDGLAHTSLQLEIRQLGDLVAQGYPAIAELNLAIIRRQL